MRHKTRESLSRLRKLATRGTLVSWSHIQEDWSIFSIEKLNDQSVRSWCRKNCKNPYAIYNGRCAFSAQKEAFRFSLQFGLVSISQPLENG